MRKNLRKRNGISMMLTGFLFLFGATLAYTQPVIAVPDGFAAGTTGGGDAEPIVVFSAGDLRSAVGSSENRVVHVGGSINLGLSALAVASNTTIVGLNSDVTITGCIEIKNVNNVIVQNLNVTNPSGVATGDGIEVRGSTNVFITKCTFIDCADGSIDIVRESDFVTVSWCRFKYPNQTTHNFVNLIGNGDTATGDRGKLRVTMHHNWYDDGCQERMPRVRFGQVHVYNTYFGGNRNNYNIGVGIESQILVENSYFENQKLLWRNWSPASAQGLIQWSGLHLVGSSIPTWAPNSSVFEPPYEYELVNAVDVKEIVMEGAGNVFPTSSTLPANILLIQPSVYPNPVTNGILHIELINLTGNSAIKLMDLTGRTLLEKTVVNESKIEIPITAGKGVYLITITNNGKVFTHKVVATK